MSIRRLASGDDRELEKLSSCFDQPLRWEAAGRFLKSENHHILVAYEGEIAIGFVTGVETTHPDKGTEMFLYELGVDEKFRRKGYGAKLVRALAELARQRRCYGMWVGTEEDNLAALKTYGTAGAQRGGTIELLYWKFANSDDSIGRCYGPPP